MLHGAGIFTYKTGWLFRANVGVHIPAPWFASGVDQWTWWNLSPGNVTVNRWVALSISHQWIAAELWKLLSTLETPKSFPRWLDSGSSCFCRTTHHGSSIYVWMCWPQQFSWALWRSISGPGIESWLSPQLPSGQLLHNYGKLAFSSWENPRFLWYDLWSSNRWRIVPRPWFPKVTWIEPSAHPRRLNLFPYLCVSFFAYGSCESCSGRILQKFRGRWSLVFVQHDMGIDGRRGYY
jgi:hypothetical protein